jgi:hypothetical protein
MSSREQWGRRLDKQPNTEGRLSGWRKMTQPGEIFLMMEASEGVLYRLAELRAAKPRVIESKHQLRGMPGRSSVISGELQAGGK